MVQQGVSDWKLMLECERYAVRVCVGAHIEPSVVTVIGRNSDENVPTIGASRLRPLTSGHLNQTRKLAATVRACLDGPQRARRQRQPSPAPLEPRPTSRTTSL